MGVNPGSQTALCIPLVSREHLLIGHKALKDRSYPHIIHRHEHSSNEPSNCCNKEQRTNDTVQLISDVMIYCEIGDASCQSGDE